MSETLFPLPVAHPPHSATYTAALLTVFARMLRPCRRVLDPFAGKGGIFLLENWLPETEFAGIELEPEWAACHPKTRQGTALDLPWPDDYFDGICTSPAYGNRMADKLLRDPTTTKTYAADLGRPLSAGSGAALQWGQAYRDLHAAAWAEALRVLQPGGLFVLNIKDHVRAGKVQPVTAWHVECLTGLGFTELEHVQVPTPSMRWGANASARVGYESVILLESPS